MFEVMTSFTGDVVVYDDIFGPEPVNVGWLYAPMRPEDFAEGEGYTLPEPYTGEDIVAFYPWFGEDAFRVIYQCRSWVSDSELLLIVVCVAYLNLTK